MKRAGSFILSLIIFFSFLFNPLIVKAETDYTIPDLFRKLLGHAASTVGAVISLDYEKFDKNYRATFESGLFNGYFQIKDGQLVYTSKAVIEDDYGYSYTDEFLDWLHDDLARYDNKTDLINQYFYTVYTVPVSAVPSYLWSSDSEENTFKSIAQNALETKGNAFLSLYASGTNLASSTKYIRYCENATDYPLLVFDKWDSSSVPWANSKMYCYNYNKRGTRIPNNSQNYVLKRITNNNVETLYPNTQKLCDVSVMLPSEGLCQRGSFYYAWLNVSLTGGTYQVFKSASVLNSYVTGISENPQKVYYSTKYYNYDNSIDNSITVNKNEINNIENITNNIINQTNTTIINEYITNGLSEQQVQAMIDAMMQAIEEMIRESGSGGGDGGDGGGGSGPDIPNGFFDAIRGFFERIIELLEKILFWVRVDAVAGVVDAVADVANLLLDKVGNVYGSITTIVGGASEVINVRGATLWNTAKTKFPFCALFDLAFVLTLFNAPPAIPHYELPVNFTFFGQTYSNTIVIDLEQYQPLATFCREAFAILFVVALIMLTVKFVGRGVEKELNDTIT